MTIFQLLPCHTRVALFQSGRHIKYSRTNSVCGMSQHLCRIFLRRSATDLCSLPTSLYCLVSEHLVHFAHFYDQPRLWKFQRFGKETSRLLWETGQEGMRAQITEVVLKQPSSFQAIPQIKMGSSLYCMTLRIWLPFSNTFKWSPVSKSQRIVWPWGCRLCCGCSTLLL